MSSLMSCSTSKMKLYLRMKEITTAATSQATGVPATATTAIPLDSLILVVLVIGWLSGWCIYFVRVIRYCSSGDHYSRVANRGVTASPTTRNAISRAQSLQARRSVSSKQAPAPLVISCSSSQTSIVFSPSLSSSSLSSRSVSPRSSPLHSPASPSPNTEAAAMSAKKRQPKLSPTSTMELIEFRQLMDFGEETEKNTRLNASLLKYTDEELKALENTGRDIIQDVLHNVDDACNDYCPAPSSAPVMAALPNDRLHFPPAVPSSPTGNVKKITTKATTMRHPGLQDNMSRKMYMSRFESSSDNFPALKHLSSLTSTITPSSSRSQSTVTMNSVPRESSMSTSTRNSSVTFDEVVLRVTYSPLDISDSLPESPSEEPQERDYKDKLDGLVNSPRPKRNKLNWIQEKRVHIRSWIMNGSAVLKRVASVHVKEDVQSQQ
mmetsp:Transcript_20259/g.34929  ORF Transcript_20259/g.34929 Transcript_20259/m.34929 type:complete len:436 (+) Transcript_20259:130-1437(+)